MDYACGRILSKAPFMILLLLDYVTSSNLAHQLIEVKGKKKKALNYLYIVLFIRRVSIPYYLIFDDWVIPIHFLQIKAAL